MTSNTDVELPSAKSEPRDQESDKEFGLDDGDAEKSTCNQPAKFMTLLNLEPTISELPVLAETVVVASTSADKDLDNEAGIGDDGDAEESLHAKPPLVVEMPVASSTSADKDIKDFDNESGLGGDGDAAETFHVKSSLVVETPVSASKSVEKDSDDDSGFGDSGDDDPTEFFIQSMKQQSIKSAPDSSTAITVKNTTSTRVSFGRGAGARRARRASTEGKAAPQSNRARRASLGNSIEIHKARRGSIEAKAPGAGSRGRRASHVGHMDNTHGRQGRRASHVFRSEKRVSVRPPEHGEEDGSKEKEHVEETPEEVMRHRAVANRCIYSKAREGLRKERLRVGMPTEGEQIPRVTLRQAAEAIKSATHQTVLSRNLLQVFMDGGRRKRERDALQVEVAKLEEEAEEQEEGGFVKEKAKWLVGLIGELEHSKVQRAQDLSQTSKLMTDLADIMAKLQSLQGLYALRRREQDVLQDSVNSMVKDIQVMLDRVGPSMRNLTAGMQDIGDKVVQEIQEDLVPEVPAVEEGLEDSPPQPSSKSRLWRKAAIVVTFERILLGGVNRVIQEAVNDASQAAINNGHGPLEMVHDLPGAPPEIPSPYGSEASPHSSPRAGSISDGPSHAAMRARRKSTLQLNIEMVRRASIEATQLVEPLPPSIPHGPPPTYQRHATRSKAVDYDFSVWEPLDATDTDTPRLSVHPLCLNAYHALGFKKTALPPSLQELSELPGVEHRLRCPFALLPMVSRKKDPSRKLPPLPKRDRKSVV